MLYILQASLVCMCVCVCVCIYVYVGGGYVRVCMCVCVWGMRKQKKYKGLSGYSSILPQVCQTKEIHFCDA